MRPARAWLAPAAAGFAIFGWLALCDGAFAQEAAAAAGGGGHDFVSHFSTFVLAIFVGYYVVWSVTPALHTPLMSVTNAISSVIVVGALLAVSVEEAAAVASSGHTAAKWLGFAALTMTCVNIFGGFLVTKRMLGMYQKKKK
jgi:NAD(P) transhydrogenase subunit alpha